MPSPLLPLKITARDFPENLRTVVPAFLPRLLRPFREVFQAPSLTLELCKWVLIFPVLFPCLFWNHCWILLHYNNATILRCYTLRCYIATMLECYNAPLFWMKIFGKLSFKIVCWGKKIRLGVPLAIDLVSNSTSACIFVFVFLIFNFIFLYLARKQIGSGPWLLTLCLLQPPPPPVLSRAPELHHLQTVSQIHKYKYDWPDQWHVAICSWQLFHFWGFFQSEKYKPQNNF